MLAAALTAACTAAGTGASRCGEVTAPPAAQPGLPESLTIGVANNVAMAAPLTDLHSPGMPATSLRTASTPEELRTNFITGRYDVAAIPINIAANLCARGIDAALLGTVSGDIIYLMGPPGTTLAGLRGQQLHIPFKNDIVDLVTRQILDQAGLSHDGDHPDVTLVYHPTPLDIASGMAADTVRYAVLPEHLATVVAETSPAVKAVSLQRLWTEQTGAATLPFAGYIIRRELADRYPDLVAKLQATFTAAAATVRADPAAGAARIAELIPVPADMTARVLPGLQPVFTPAAQNRAEVDLLYTALLDSEPESIGGALPGPGFYLDATP